MTTLTTLTTRTEAEGPPSKSASLAFARAVNLHASDLPAFKVKVEREERESPAEKQISREVERCVGASLHIGAPLDETGKHRGKQSEIAEVGSPSFQREPEGAALESVSSKVTVLASEEIALLQLKVIKSESTGACLAHYLGLILRAQKQLGAVRLHGLTISKINAPANGFGWRVKLTLTDHHISLPLQMQMLGFVVGRAEVSLMVLGVPVPFPIEEERKLVKLLMQRAKTQPL